MPTDTLFWHYTLLAFGPLAVMSGITWWSFFDRRDSQREPIMLVLLAVIAGALSACIVVGIGQLADAYGAHVPLLGVVGLEELVKCSLLTMCIYQVGREFEQLYDGILYGATVGLGFATVENILYLYQSFSTGGSVFTDQFWITFQGRFWTATLLHALLGALFGSYLAAAYLLRGYLRADAMSGPLTIRRGTLLGIFRDLVVASRTLQRPLWQVIVRVLSLHITRQHLVFAHNATPNGHLPGEVVLEGLWLVLVVHTLYNVALVQGYIATALIVLCILSVVVLRRMRFSSSPAPTVSSPAP